MGEESIRRDRAPDLSLARGFWVSWLQGQMNVSVTARLPSHSRTQDVMSHVCYEGGCASNQKRHTFSSVRALRTHQYRCHQDALEDEMSLGNARALKRKHDAEDEETHKRQRLEAQMALEAANCEPEPQPVWLIDPPFRKQDFSLHCPGSVVGAHC